MELDRAREVRCWTYCSSLQKPSSKNIGWTWRFFSCHSAVTDRWERLWLLVAIWPCELSLLGSPSEMLLQAVALDSCWALRTKSYVGIHNCRWSSEIQPPTSDNGCIFFTPTITFGSDLDTKHSSQSLIHIITWILRGGKLSIPSTRHEPSDCNLGRTIQTNPARNREWARLHRTRESETSAYENRGPGE